MAGAVKFLFALVVASCAALPVLAGPLTPQEVDALAFAQHPGAQLDGTITLADESGEKVTLASLVAGRPTILVLDYLRCPNLCGLVLAGLGDALAKTSLTAGRDYRVLALSIDAQETAADAASARADYARRYPEEIGGWHFLTGRPDDVRHIAATVGFPYRWDESIRQFAHPAGLTLLQPGGAVSGYLLGIAPTPLDLQQALVQASEARVAAPASRLLLLCFGYDPASGRYDLSILRATRIVGAIVLALLAALVIALKLRERRA